MKAAILALSGLLAVVTVPSAHADEWLPSKKGATLFGSIAAGVALGGPVGMLAGAAVGAWLNETLDDAAEVDVSREQLAQAKTQMQQSSGTVARLEHQLAQARDTSKQYAQLVLDQLELEMLFKTNATELTAAGQKRVARLADFLVANPQLEVRLDGYADPRGEDSYNQQLSLGRVSHVARMLMDFGVEEQRIASFSHGASGSEALSGDYDAYALERAVRINLSQSSAAGYAGRD